MGWATFWATFALTHQRTFRKFYPLVIRLQLASLFGKIWEEFSPENVTKAFTVNQHHHNI
jgi:hypothetical protein